MLVVCLVKRSLSKILPKYFYFFERLLNPRRFKHAINILSEQLGTTFEKTADEVLGKRILLRFYGTGLMRYAYDVDVLQHAARNHLVSAPFAVWHPSSVVENGNPQSRAAD